MTQTALHQVTFKGRPIHLVGHLPSLHALAPDFVLVNHDLEDISLANFRGKKKLLATVPSLDTNVCSTMTQHLNSFAKKHHHGVVIVVSADLPFAQKRFCSSEHVHNVSVLSMMRNKDFGKAYGLLMQDGPLGGLLARSLMVLDEKDHLLYAEVVSEVTHEPNYEKAQTFFTHH